MRRTTPLVFSLSPLLVLACQPSGGHRAAPGASSDTADLSVVAIVPADGQVSVAIEQFVQVGFSHPLEASSFSADSLQLTNMKSGKQVKGQVAAGGAFARFTPQADLVHETRYELRISEGIRSRDRAHRLSGPVTVRFTTELLPAMKIVSKYPEDAETETRRDLPLQVSFSGVLDRTTVGPHALTVTSDRGPVEGTVTVDRQDLTFTPLAPLEKNTTYTARLDPGLKSTQGFPLREGFEWTFETTPYLTILDISPAPEETGVGLRPPRVEVTFLEKLDPKTFDEELTLRVFEPDGSLFPGFSSLEENRVLFTPTLEYLHPDAEYRCALDAGLQDATGAGLPEGREWVFQTQPMTRIRAIYCNEDNTPSNLVTAMAVDESGGLREIPGSPFLTGGLGLGHNWDDSIELDPTGNLLFALNHGSADLSSFTVNADYSLTLVTAEPLALNSFRPVSLAVHPFLNLIFVANWGSDSISTARYDASGHLELVKDHTPTGLPEPVFLSTNNAGTLLFTSFRHDPTCEVFRIDPKGNLEPLLFTESGQSRVFDVCTNLDDTVLYQSELNDRLIFGFDLPSFTQLPGSPYAIDGEVYGVAAIDVHPSGKFLFTAYLGDGFGVYHIAEDGSISLHESSPFELDYPRGPKIAYVSRDGTMLATGSAGSELVATYSIQPDGTISPIDKHDTIKGLDSNISGVCVLER